MLSDGVIGNVTGLPGILPAAEMQLGEILLQPFAFGLGGSQLFVEPLDVAHGAAGVPHRCPFHLIGHCIPFRVQAGYVGHYCLGYALPIGRDSGAEYLNCKVVGPPAGVKPSFYRQLLLGCGIDPAARAPYLPRLLCGSAGVRAYGS